MSANPPFEQYERDRIWRYLLGGLPSAERTAIQDRMFHDSEFFARMRLAEMDLIDACAGGWLPANSIEPARRYLAESGQTEALAASAGLAAAIPGQELPEGLLGKLRQRFSGSTV